MKRDSIIVRLPESLGTFAAIIALYGLMVWIEVKSPLLLVAGFFICLYIARMEAQNPILQYLATAQQQQTPVMSNGSAHVSRLTVHQDNPLHIEIELTIGADQVRTYDIRKLADGPDNSSYQVGPVQSGVAGPFSKLSESDLYYMVSGKPLNDEEDED